MPYTARGYYAGRYSGGRFINKFKNAAKKLNSFAKNTQIVSKVLGQINNPTAQKIAKGAASMGYGYRGCGKKKEEIIKKKKILLKS